jgi:hypothetical protein
MAHCHVPKQKSMTVLAQYFLAKGFVVWFWKIWHTVIFFKQKFVPISAHSFLADVLYALYLIALPLRSPDLTFLDFKIWGLLRNVMYVAPWAKTAGHRGGIQDGLRYTGDVGRTRPSLVELWDNPGISHRTPAGKSEVFTHVVLMASCHFKLLCFQRLSWNFWRGFCPNLYINKQCQAWGRLVGDLLSRCASSIPGQSLWDLWWTKGNMASFYPST